jgi:O-antigen ligase
MSALMRWLLGLYVVFLGSEEYFAGPGPVYKLGVTLVVLFFLALLLGKVRIRFSTVGALMGLYASFALSSTLWSVDTQRTLSYAFILVQLLVTAWITASCVEDQADIDRLTWCLVLASAFPAIALAHDYLLGGSWSLGFLKESLKEYAGRMTFGDADPNLLAYRFVVSIIAATHLALNARAKPLKLALFAVAGFYAATSLLTGSRGGGLALVVATMVLLTADLRQKKGTVLLVLAGLVVLLVVAMPYLPPGLSDRYLGIRQEVATGSMAGRKDIYRESFESFGDHPVLGVGYLAFESASRQHGGRGSAAHNDPLQNLVDMGLVGLGIYLVLMASLFWKASSLPPPLRGFALGLLAAYCVPAFSITLLSMKLPWVVFGFIAGAPRPQAGPSRSRVSAFARWSHREGEDRHD